MRICDWFDPYRDGELSVAERHEFESHLKVCEGCRAKKSLLDHVVFLAKSEKLQPIDMADRIARRAFLPESSWASDVIACLRPLPAMAALSLALLGVSSLWISLGNGNGSAYVEYEQLIEDASVENLSPRLFLTAAESSVVNWLEPEGDTQ